MSNILFETTRLAARPLQPADLPALLDVYGDADAMRWVGEGRAITTEECIAWLEVTAANYQRHGYGMCALVERESGTVVGFCGLVHPGGQPEAEIKYAFRRSCWGRGFATEAARALLAWGAARHGLRRVIATTAPENTASHRVLTKAGMRAAGLRQNDDGSRTQLFAWEADDAAHEAASGAA